MAAAATRLFWTKIHRWLGLTAMLFLFIAGVTGSLLCFDKEIDAALNADLFARNTNAAAWPAPVVADHIQKLRPDLMITEFPLSLGDNDTLKLSVVAKDRHAPLDFDELFVDPSNGRIAGTRMSGPGWDRRHIVEAIFQLHQNLIAGKWGRWVMGVAALAWLIGNCVGLYLTLPAKLPFWRKWWKKWKIDLRANSRRLMLEIHNSTGLWLLIPATVLAFTSVAMNFFDEAYEPLVEAVLPAKPSIFDSSPPTTAHSAQFGFGRALELGSAGAKQADVSWKPALERYNSQYGVYGISFTDNGRVNYHRLGPVVVYLSDQDGSVVEVNDPYHDTTGRKLVRVLYPLHSGQVAGSFGIALIFLLGLSTAEMCVTGLYTWWKKRTSRRPRGRQST